MFWCAQLTRLRTYDRYVDGLTVGDVTAVTVRHSNTVVCCAVGVSCWSFCRCADSAEVDGVVRASNDDVSRSRLSRSLLAVLQRC